MNKSAERARALIARKPDKEFYFESPIVVQKSPEGAIFLDGLVAVVGTQDPLKLRIHLAPEIAQNLRGALEMVEDKPDCPIVLNVDQTN